MPWQRFGVDGSGSPVRTLASAVGVFVARARALWLALGGLSGGSGRSTGWTRPFAVERHDDAAHSRHRRRALRADSTETARSSSASSATPRSSPRRRLPSASSLGAVFGFALGVVLAHFASPAAGLLPVHRRVADDSDPRASRRWSSSGSGLNLPGGRSRTGCAVAVIAAYLTFFPVTINTAARAHSADPRALELMRSYAAGRWAVLWKLRVPGRAPVHLLGAQDRGHRERRRRDHRRAAVVDPERPRRRDPQLQPVLRRSSRTSLWATNLIAALLGILFFLAVVLAEQLVVRRAPEHLA